MSDEAEAISAEFDAFEPSDDSIDNEERLQILVDRWQEVPDNEQAAPAMLRIFERYPEATNLGEPGPLVHAIEEAPGYEQLLATSLETSPSYYGVWMVNRILESDLPTEVRDPYLALMHRMADSETAPWSVRGAAKQFLEFLEG
jgi:hypothetical protein